MTMVPKTLLVYYSRTGATRMVAELVAAQLACDVEELVDTRNRVGFWGFLRSGFDAHTGALTRLRPTRYDPAAYDLVIIGTPVWSAVSTPVRTYLAQHTGRFDRVAFFLTQHGTGNREKVFRQLADLCGRAPLATLALNKRDGAERTVVAKVQAFVRALGTAPADAGTPVPAGVGAV